MSDETTNGPDCAPDCKPRQTVPGEPAPTHANPPESRPVALTSPERHPGLSACVKAWGRRLLSRNHVDLSGLERITVFAAWQSDCAPDCKSTPSPAPAPIGGDE